jgi:hypothetical protein
MATNLQITNQGVNPYGLGQQYQILNPYQINQPNWSPALPLFVQQPISQAQLNPNLHQQYWQTQASAVMTNPQLNENQVSFNNWDPAMSTNVSSLISQSIQSTADQNKANKN